MNSFSLYYLFTECCVEMELRKQKALKLKVRIKGIIDDLESNLKNLKEHNPRILDFVAKVVSDGNYFPREILWKSERAQLELTKLGQTRFMILEEGKEYRYKRAKLLVRSPCKYCI